jgi:hypothetical protein
MKLFIFEPYEWEYCGGALGVIAESYEQAIQLLLNIKDSNDDHEFKSEFFAKNKTDAEKFNETIDKWLLTQEVELKCDLKPEVILNNWNWA